MLADSTIWQRLCILHSDKDFIDREDARGCDVIETAKDLATLSLSPDFHTQYQYLFFNMTTQLSLPKGYKEIVLLPGTSLRDHKSCKIRDLHETKF